LSAILIKSNPTFVAAAFLVLLLGTACTTDSGNSQLSVADTVEGSTVDERTTLVLEVSQADSANASGQIAVTP